MMHGREKSDSAIVAGKPTNNAVLTAAEPVERRAGAEGNAIQQSTGRAQNGTNRVTSAGAHTVSRLQRPTVTHPGSRVREFRSHGLSGGRSVMAVPTSLQTEFLLTLTRVPRWLVALALYYTICATTQLWH